MVLGNVGAVTFRARKLVKNRGRKKEKHLDFKITVLIRFFEGSEGVLATKNILKQFLTAEVAVYYGIREQLGDVALGCTIRAYARRKNPVSVSILLAWTRPICFCTPQMSKSIRVRCHGSSKLRWKLLAN